MHFIKFISAFILIYAQTGCIEKKPKTLSNDEAPSTEKNPEENENDGVVDIDVSALSLVCEKLENSADNVVNIGCNIRDQGGAVFSLPQEIKAELIVYDQMFSPNSEIRVKELDDGQLWRWLVDIRTSLLFKNLFTLNLLKDGDTIGILQTVPKIEENLQLNHIKYSALGAKKDYRFGSEVENCVGETDNKDVLAGSLIVVPFFFVDPIPGELASLAFDGICGFPRDDSQGMDVKIVKSGQVRASSYFSTLYTVAAIGSFSVEGGVYNLVINVPKGNLRFNSIHLRTDSDFLPVFGAPVFNLEDAPKDPGVTPELNYMKEEPLENVIHYPKVNQ